MFSMAPPPTKRRRLDDEEGAVESKKLQIITDEETEPSAVSRVFAIPELLEAILVPYGQQCRQRMPSVRSSRIPYVPGFRSSTLSLYTIHEPTLGPALGLFALQRVSHSFATTIRRSQSLRNLMCLGSSNSSISMLSWFLTVLGMEMLLELPHDGSSIDMDEEKMGDLPRQKLERYKVFSNGHGIQQWALPRTWRLKDAPWAGMKIFGDTDSNCYPQEIQLDFDEAAFQSSRRDPFEQQLLSNEDPARRLKSQLYRQSMRTSSAFLLCIRQEDDPTLGDVYREFEETVQLHIVEMEGLGRLPDSCFSTRLAF